ncbi:MAG TPA: hypothetical protein VGS17_07415 [Candidatus Limnocylindria bacterium]|nr:hypothetical protein [Candidatus Limnocylindria bacterium]
MRTPGPLCLRCAERPATKGWQCADCAESFADWVARDWHGALAVLDEQARWLAKSADRLDGVGFWAAAKAVWQAAEAVEVLAQAIEQQDPGSSPPLEAG